MMQKRKIGILVLFVSMFLVSMVAVGLAQEPVTEIRGDDIKSATPITIKSDRTASGTVVMKTRTVSHAILMSYADGVFYPVTDWVQCKIPFTKKCDFSVAISPDKDPNNVFHVVVADAEKQGLLHFATPGAGISLEGGKQIPIIKLRPRITEVVIAGINVNLPNPDPIVLTNNQRFSISVKAIDESSLSNIQVWGYSSIEPEYNIKECSGKNCNFIGDYKAVAGNPTNIYVWVADTDDNINYLTIPFSVEKKPPVITRIKVLDSLNLYQPPNSPNKYFVVYTQVATDKNKVEVDVRDEDNDLQTIKLNRLPTTASETVQSKESKPVCTGVVCKATFEIDVKGQSINNYYDYQLIAIDQQGQEASIVFQVLHTTKRELPDLKFGVNVLMTSSLEGIKVNQLPGYDKCKDVESVLAAGTSSSQSANTRAMPVTTELSSSDVASYPFLVVYCSDIGKDACVQTSSYSDPYSYEEYCWDFGLC